MHGCTYNFIIVFLSTLQDKITTHHFSISQLYIPSVVAILKYDASELRITNNEIDFHPIAPSLPRNVVSTLQM